MIRSLLLLVLCATCQSASMAAEAGCRAADALRIRVRFAGAAPLDVLVESVVPYGLRLRDTSGNEIWSAGPGTATTQQFPGMDAGFGASFTAVHLDADGVHDRLYAGDRAGRLWRFDLRAGARPAAFMAATVLADLGVPGGGRGFVAPPDVARIETPAGSSWLNIAIGTASTGAPRNDQRFYVLRDSIADRPGAPLVEADLAQLSPPAGVVSDDARGYFLHLGTAQVLAQSLTLNGRIYFTAVESARTLLAACALDSLPDSTAPLSVTVLRAEDGAVEPAIAPETGANAVGQGSTANLRHALAGSLPASTGVVLAPTPADSRGHVPCLVGNEPLPACFLDTRPRRSWWRREDAD